MPSLISKAVAAVTALALFVSPGMAYGDDALTPKKVVVDGREGVWLPADQASKVLERLERVDKLEGLISSQGTLVDLQEMQARTASVVIETQRELIGEHKARGDEFKKTAEAAIKDRDSFTRAPVLWLSIGAALAAGLIAIAAATISAGQPDTVVVGAK